MNPKHVNINNRTKVPLRYVPKNLTIKDKKKQKKNLSKSRKLYKKGIYYTRPKVKSFKSRKSNHLEKLKEMYGVENANPTQELASKTKCNLASLEKIVNKGEGAYYSSGSRPNQTARSWGLARLASTLTGGNASVIDYHLLKEGCSSDSPALKAAKKKCKEVGRKCGNNKTKNIKGGDDDDNDPDECSICFDPIYDNQEKFTCENDRRHVFHNECIRSYCRTLYGVRVFPCPICRYINTCPRDREAPPPPPLFINPVREQEIIAEIAAAAGRREAAGIRSPRTRRSSGSRRSSTTRTSPTISNMPQEHPFRPYTDEINNSMREGFNGIRTGPMSHFISNSGDNIYTTMIDGFGNQVSLTARMNTLGDVTDVGIILEDNVTRDNFDNLWNDSDLVSQKTYGEWLLENRNVFNSGRGNQSEEAVSPYVDEMLRNEQFITRRLYRSESGRGELYDGETHMYLGDHDDNIFDVLRFIYRNVRR